MALYRVGEVYNRSVDIHATYRGQQQGGISTPADHPLVFLFTGSSGHAHGYVDGFDPETGSYLYFGEGQSGDMEMIRGNRAIRDHQSDGKTMHLFSEHGSGTYKYMGEATYLNHFEQQAADTDGALRRAYVFELDLSDPGLAGIATVVREPARPRYSGMSMAELRELAVSRASEDLPPKERRELVRHRSEAVKQYVLRRARGFCEGCGAPAPFKTKKNKPYLEPHHVRRIADGGPDDPHWVIALCPSCHRRVHHGMDGDEYNEMLKELLVKIESERGYAS